MFDFVERYMAMGMPQVEATALYATARKGEFPPWAPTRSRGQDCVAKLLP